MNLLIFIITLFAYLFLTLFIYFRCYKLDNIILPGSIFIIIFSLNTIIYSIYINLFHIDYFSSLIISEDLHLTHSISLALSAFGILCYWFGYSLSKYLLTIKFHIEFKRNFLYSIKPSFLLIVAVLFFGCILFFLMLHQVDAFSDIQLFQKNYRAGLFVGSGAMTGLLVMILPPILFFYYLSLIKSGAKDKIYWAVIYIAIAVAVIVPLVLGFRIMLVSLIPGLIWIYNSNFQKINIKKLFFIFLFFILFIAFYGSIRANSEAELSGVQTIPINLLDTLVSPFIRNNSTGIVAAAIKFSANHNYFMSIFNESFLNLIPRVHRPIFMMQTEIFGSEVMGEFFFERDGNTDSFGGISPTPIGFSYWQGGLMGVIFYMSFLGVLSFCTDKFMTNNSNSIYQSYIFINLGIFIISQTDSPQEAFNLLVFRIILLLPIFLYFRIFQNSIKIKKTN